jgi:hypothetical protein
MDSELVKAIGPTLVAAIVFLAGLLQYAKAQEWKRSEFAATQLELLWSDQRIRFACIALDWKKKRVMVPEEYNVFAPDLSFVHDVITMQEALETEAKRMDFAWPRSYYQECFDRFFEYLSLIDHYISIGLFTTRDILPLHYWLKLVANPKYVGNKDVFRAYCEYYGFDGVFNLLQRMEIESPSREIAQVLKERANSSEPTPK